MPRIWPPALQPGDLVAAVAPSGAADPERLARGIALVESWGLRVRLAPHVTAGHPELGYLAATDQQRADDLRASWLDPEVRAVWAVRGGYGAQRMIDLLDWRALRAAGPKHLIGFSDVTALHSRLGRELGQVTFHGPGLASTDQLSDPPSADALRSLIFAVPAPGTILAEGRALVGGSAVSPLLGGNLSLLAADLGVEPPWPSGSILLLEEVNEPAYRVDRMLTQLLRSDWLAELAGVVLGDLGLPDDLVPLDRLGQLGVPVLTGVAVGHGHRNLALPLGADVRLEVPEPPGRGLLRLGPVTR